MHSSSLCINQVVNELFVVILGILFLPEILVKVLVILLKMPIHARCWMEKNRHQLANTNTHVAGGDCRRTELYIFLCVIAKMGQDVGTQRFIFMNWGDQTDGKFHF